MQFVVRIFVFCYVLLIANSVSAQTSDVGDYPNRPVRVIVPFPAGGPTDVTARLVMQYLTQRLGQRFYIENMSGAGGNTGVGAGARAAPDGYTIIIVSSGFTVNPALYVKVPYDARQDFEPISLIAASPNVLVINPSVPVSNVKEFVDLIKKNPGKYSYAGSAIGSTPHLSGELFKQQFDLDYINVPFAGAAPAIQSTIGGHTPSAWAALPTALAAIQGGQLKALAVTSEKRNPRLPDVPTMAEAGIEGQAVETLTGMVVPARTPKKIVDFLYGHIAKIVATDEVIEKFLTLGFVPVGSTPQEFAARIDSELIRWEKVISQAKLPRIE